VTAGDAGAFSRSVTIPGGASGTVSFQAVGQSSGQWASAAYKVEKVTGPSEPPPSNR